MLKAIKAGRSIRIPDEKMAAYVSLGYTIKDMAGNEINLEQKESAKNKGEAEGKATKKASSK